MMKMLDLFRRNDGAAALEAALVAPLFLALTVGIADLGMGMFQAMDVNAAAQAGAMYVVINRTTSGDQPLMNDAAGDATVTVSQSISAGVVTVTATHAFSPVLPGVVNSQPRVLTWLAGWPSPFSSTVTIRIQ